MKNKCVLISYKSPSLISEIKELVKASGYIIKEIYTQKRLSRTKFGIGSGKAQEIADYLEENPVDVIIIDEKLSVSQIYNLTKITRTKVIDREKLILEIFAKRALTTESKLQVKLAELKYDMPQIKEKVRLAKIGEQPGFYGLGQYEVEKMRLDLKKRIWHITKKLEDISVRRELHRVNRNKHKLYTITVAGYTSAGKTSLFNILTDEENITSKGLFTTLTTTTRASNLFSNKILISDTVGFIRRLPTYMIKAFKSTLDDLVYSNLIILVIDLMDSKNEIQSKYIECKTIMESLGISNDKIIIACNKIDKITKSEIKVKIDFLNNNTANMFLISAKTGFGVKGMISHITTYIDAIINN